MKKALNIYKWKAMVGAVAFLVLAVAAPAAVKAGGQPAGQAAPVCVKRVLPCGLVVAVEKVPGLPQTAVHVLVRNRAAGEPAGCAGFTDLAHRLLLEPGAGTGRAEALQRLQAIGARVSTVDDPAIPFDDYTTVEEFSWVRLQVLDRFRDEGLTLLARLLKEPEPTPEALRKAFEAQSKICLQRARSPKAAAESTLWGLLFPGTWKTRPVYGDPAARQAPDPAVFRAFAAGLFRPENLVLSVQTGAEPAQVVARLAALFPGSGGAPAPRVPLGLPAEGADAAIREVKLMARQSYLLGADAFPVAAADRPALDVLAAMLSERVSFELREKRGLAYSVGAGLELLDGGRTAVLSVGLGTRPENVETARSAIEEVMKAFAAEPLDGREVRKAVRRLQGRFLMRCLASLTRAYYMGLDLYAGGEAPGAYRQRPAGWGGVSLEELLRARRDFFRLDRFRWVAAGP